MMMMMTKLIRSMTRRRRAEDVDDNEEEDKGEYGKEEESWGNTGDVDDKVRMTMRRTKMTMVRMTKVTMTRRRRRAGDTIFQVLLAD